LAKTTHYLLPAEAVDEQQRPKLFFSLCYLIFFLESSCPRLHLPAHHKEFPAKTEDRGKAGTWQLQHAQQPPFLFTKPELTTIGSAPDLLLELSTRLVISFLPNVFVVKAI
jgi:hypothetical protein